MTWSGRGTVSLILRVFSSSVSSEYLRDVSAFSTPNANRANDGFRSNSSPSPRWLLEPPDHHDSPDDRDGTVVMESRSRSEEAAKEPIQLRRPAEDAVGEAPESLWPLDVCIDCESICRSGNVDVVERALAGDAWKSGVEARKAGD